MDTQTHPLRAGGGPAVTFLANKTPPAGRMTFMAPWYSPDYTYQPNHP